MDPEQNKKQNQNKNNEPPVSPPSPPPHPKIVFNSPPHPKVTKSPDQGASEAQSNVKKSTPTIRSYAYDIKSKVRDEGVSLAQIVMAEERKKEETHQTEADITTRDKQGTLLKFMLISIGIIALLGGVAAYLFTIYSRAPVSTNVNTPSPGLIRTEKITPIVLKDGYKTTLLQAVSLLKTSSIPQGTLNDIQFKESVGNENLEVNAFRFLVILESKVPETLSRSLLPGYSFGLHSLEKNEPYIILQSESYENAFSGMLEWEKTIIDDIGPLFFTRDDLANPTSTADIGKQNFKDTVIYNKDSRTIVDEENRILMLWSIIDQHSIIITSNSLTLEEIVKRLTTSRIVR